jgi:hypothetical protein
MLGDQEPAEPGGKEALPEEVEEPTWLDRHSETPPCHEVELVEGFHDVALTMRPPDKDPFALGSRDVPTDLGFRERREKLIRIRREPEYVYVASE